MIKNPENFLDMVRTTIFERSQDFQKEFSNDFKKVLSGCKLDYLEYLRTYGLDNDSIEYEEINKIWNRIFNVLTSSLSGKRSTAYIQLKNILNGLFSENIVYTHDKDLALYRMRVCSLRKNISRQEIFHIPFNLIRNIKTQRYSTPGYPCLYIAKSLYGCWEEMHRPQIESTLVSRFTPTDSFRVLDMRIPTVERFKKYEQLYLKFLPIIIASTIPVRNVDDVFKPEYIIPQFILEWCIEKGQEHHLLGIIYTSSFCNREFFELDYEWENIALPVQKMKSDSNYCPVLASLFKVTKPTCYEYEVMLGNLRLFSYNDEDNCQYFDGDKDKTSYYMSSFHLLEGVLFEKESDLIFRDMKA